MPAMQAHLRLSPHKSYRFIIFIRFFIFMTQKSWHNLAEHGRIFHNTLSTPGMRHINSSRAYSTGESYWRECFFTSLAKDEWNFQI